MNSTSGNPFRRVEEIRQEDIPSDVPPPECDHCWPGVVPSRILTETGRASSCISGSCAGSPLIGFQPVGWYCRGGTNRPTTARRVQESVGQLHVNSAGFLDDELLVPYRVFTVAVDYAVAGQAVSGFAAVEQVADGAAVLGTVPAPPEGTHP